MLDLPIEALVGLAWKKKYIYDTFVMISMLG